MEEFIHMASGKLGIGESTARSATGGLLQMVKSAVGGGDFDQLADKVPGLADTLQAAPEAAGGQQEGGSALGGLMSKAASLVGGEAGAALNVAGLMKNVGLDMGQGTSLAGMLVSFLKEKAGGDLMTRILGQVPELKKLVG